MGDDDRFEGLADGIGAELSGTSAPVPTAPPRSPEPPPPRRRAPGKLIAGVVAAVVLVGLGILAVTGDDPSSEETSPTALGDPETPGAPAPIDRTDPHLWLSAQAVGTKGANVGVVLVDPDGDFGIYGVGATLDRWEDDRWTDPQRVVLCTAWWACAGEIDPDPPAAQPDIGLYAQDGIGPQLWMGVEGLEPGWYRLRTENTEDDRAAGIFLVAEEAPAAPDLDPSATPAVAIEPSLWAPDAEIEAAIGVVSDDGTGNDAALAGQATTIQRWKDGRWVDVDVEASITAGRPEGGDGATLHVAPLEVGDYRVVVGEDRLVGALWVRLDP